MPVKVSEAYIERRACKYARSIGYFEAKFKSVHNRAVPDRLFITPNGYVFFIEFKAPGKSATEAQLRKHEQMHADIHVIDNLKHALELLDRMARIH